MADAGLGRKRSLTRKITPEVPERDEALPRPHGADADRTGGVVAAAAGHRRCRPAGPSAQPARRAAARTLAAFDEARHVRDRQPAGGQHLVRPAAPADIEPQRARRVGHLADLLAGELQAQPVLGQQHAAHARERSRGSCSRSQPSLGAVKPGIARLPVMACSRGTRRLERRARARRCGRRSTGWPGAAPRQSRRAARRRASGPTGRSRAPPPSRPAGRRAGAASPGPVQPTSRPGAARSTADAAAAASAARPRWRRCGAARRAAAP